MKRSVRLLAIGLGAAMGCACTGPVSPSKPQIRVNSADALNALNGQLRPGDVVVLAEGIYTDRHFVFAGQGAEDRPITLRADVPGKTVVTGSSRLSIAGEHLVVEGLNFRDGALEVGSAIIEFRSPDGTPSRDCILRDTAIQDYNLPNRRHDISGYRCSGRATRWNIARLRGRRIVA